MTISIYFVSDLYAVPADKMTMLFFYSGLVDSGYPIVDSKA